MKTLRTVKGEAIYSKHKKNRKDDPCPLCNEELLHHFTYWKVITNSFPYDRIARVHDMVVPIRHVVENKLTKDELEEYEELKNGFLSEKYTYFIEVSAKEKTILNHFHIHLINLKTSFC